MIVLTPNRSASWSQTKILLWILCPFVLLVALAWSLSGAWLILPFAGLEVGLLSYLMYRVSQQSYRREVITITANDIRVQQGLRYPNRLWRLPVPDTYLHVAQGALHHDLPDLTLSAGQIRLPIGRFLNQPDRLETRQQLAQAGLMVCCNRWWQQ